MNNIKNIKKEDAVSPVIGVILMVVITVILAAVLAVFAFGVGAPERYPQAKLKITANSTAFTLEHTGGDPLKLSDLEVSINKGAFAALGVGCTGGLAVPGTAACTHTMSSSGNVDNVKIRHKPSGQIITDVDVAIE